MTEAQRVAQDIQRASGEARPRTLAELLHSEGIGCVVDADDCYLCEGTEDHEEDAATIRAWLEGRGA